MNRMRSDLFTTYEVTPEGYIVNTNGRRVKDIERDVVEKLQQQFPEVWDQLDYFYRTIDYRQDPDARWPEAWRWVAVYYVTGSSEGFYFHVDVRTHDESAPVLSMFVGKTLSESRDDAERIQNALARVFEV